MEMKSSFVIPTRVILGGAIAVLSLSACSERTQDGVERTAKSVAADTEANAEVMGEALQDGASKAAGKVSKGAAIIEEDLNDGDRNDAGTLNGTDSSRNDDSDLN